MAARRKARTLPVRRKRTAGGYSLPKGAIGSKLPATAPPHPTNTGNLRKF